MLGHATLHHTGFFLEKKRVQSERNEEKWGEGECPLLLSGLFPGDAMNGERVKYTPVEKVVEAIARVPPDSSEMSVRLIYH